MFNHEIFAVTIGRALSLFRADSPDPEQQKAALRAVHALTSLASAAVRVYEGALSIDDVGISPDLPAVAEVVRRMQEHGLAEVTLARGAPPADLLAFLRTLAADPEIAGDAGTMKRRLGAAGAASIVVLPVRALDGISGRRAASVTQAFEMASLDLSAADPPSPGPGADRRAPPGALEPEAGDWASPVGVPADTPLGAALEALTRDPYGARVLDRLCDVAAEVGAALANDQVELAAQALAAVVGLEPGAPEGTPRSSYVICLNRALTRDALAQMAPLSIDARLAPIATAVLQRGGGDAVELLLGLLATAQTIRERKAYMTVLRGMRAGTERAIAMLDSPEWFVARNVAELVGELRMEEAVAPLAGLLGHADGRVRRAAAVALSKIGSVATVEPLRRALRDGTPELRAVVAGSIGGSGARALAMPLVALADEEGDPAVLVEYYRALGRIGTPEAVQALVKAAQPGSLLRRRPLAVRLAAIEALGRAGGPVSQRALESLRTDGDRAVREAAEKAAAGAP